MIFPINRYLQRALLRTFLPVLLVLLVLPVSTPVHAVGTAAAETTQVFEHADADVEAAAGYVARKDGLRTFFNALSARLKKPVIVSQKAARKQISGDFELTRPQALLERIAAQLGLIWYHDGQTIYVYEAGETRNAMIALPDASLAMLNDFLRKSGLYDRRFPLRDGGSGIFYVSGPPMYIELVENAARFLGRKSSGDALGRLRIEVVRLENTFVADRDVTVRDSRTTVPGIATVIEQLLRDEQLAVDMRIENELVIGADPSAPPHPRGMPAISDMPPFPPGGGVAAQAVVPYPPPAATALQRQSSSPQSSSLSPPVSTGPDEPGKIRVIAYRDTNSLLVRGTQAQVDFVKHLIKRLDVAKRHIELSLWIIDLKKGDLDRLGVNWSGGVAIGGKVGATFNNAISTLDGARFVANILAMEKNEKSRIVSRPVVLTQENVPALFDNNQTVYTKLLAERAVQMEKVTFGTMINVLPRFAQDGEIEMSLTIEDGNQVEGDGNTIGSDINVSRTHISTVARVPKGMSLLIGGYTRDISTDVVDKIPLLGDLPGIGGLFRSRKHKEDSVVRVFLIQPKHIEEAFKRDAGDLSDDLLSDTPRDPQHQLLRDLMDGKNGD